MAPRRRQADRPKRTQAERYVSDRRRAWVTLKYDELVLYVNPPEEDEEGLATDGITVMNLRASQKWTTDLTRMTLAELEAFEQLWLLAFQLAKPLVTERDRKARADHEAGIGTQYRLYNRPPVTVGLSGDQREYVEGLLFGPAPISRRNGLGDSGDRGVRGAGDDVAPDESQEGGSQNERETPYFD